MSAERPDTGIEIVAAAQRLATYDRVPVHAGPTFEILMDPATGNLAIHCLRCSRVSFHFEDIGQRYCGFCHRFHEEGCA